MALGEQFSVMVKDSLMHFIKMDRKMEFQDNFKSMDIIMLYNIAMTYKKE